jgi:hypothetical protein
MWWPINDKEGSCRRGIWSITPEITLRFSEKPWNILVSKCGFRIKISARGLQHVTIKWDKVSNDIKYVRFIHVKCAWKKKRLAIYARSFSRSMIPINCKELLRGPSATIGTIILQCRESFVTALVPQLQLWHIQQLVFASAHTISVHKCRACCTSYLKEKLHQSSKRISAWTTSTSARQRFLPYLRDKPDYHRHWGFTASRNASRVRLFPVMQSQSRPTV